MLSQKTRYAIRALQHLADRYRQGPVPLNEIATRQNIPSKFLTVILSELAREGLVATQRGRDGGYWLALAPVDISYGDIVRLTRGSLARSDAHTSELQSLMRTSYAVLCMNQKSSTVNKRH